MSPSFTGDENAARCDESAFKYTWMVGNAAVLYDRLGFRNILNFGFSYQGDYLLALAEERRAARQEASGKIAKHRKDARRRVRVQEDRAVEEHAHRSELLDGRSATAR